MHCSFHTDRAATTHLLRPGDNITLNGIVANSSRVLLVESMNVASNSAPHSASMTVTTLVDCWLVKIIVL